MPEIKLTREEAYRQHDDVMSKVVILADFAEDYGSSELHEVFYHNEFNPQLIADVLASLRQGEMFMITGGAKELYSLWCEAFKLHAHA